MSMTPREILIAAVRGEQADRRAAAVQDGGAWQLQRAQLSLADLLATEDHGAAMSLEAAADWGSDIVWVNGAGFGTLIEALGCEIEYRVGEPGTIVKPALANIDDFGKLPQDPAAIREAILGHERTMALVDQMRRIVEGNNGERCTSAVLTGPFTFAGQMMDMSEFVKGVLRKPKEYKVFIDWAVQAQIVLADLLLESGADMALAADPLASADVISPKVFDNLAKPALTELISHIKQRNSETMFGLHICGHTVSRLEPVKETGIDMFAYDQNGMAESREIIDGAYALMGNVPPSQLLLNGTPDEVTAYCQQLLAEAEGYPKFILTPGCDMAPHAPLANIQAMTNSVR